MVKLDNIFKVVVHHSQSPGGGVEFIRYLHKEENSWDDVGYHYIDTNGKSHGKWKAGRDGEIQIGRETKWQGAHVRGFNKNAIGICLIGNFMLIQPTPKQVNSLIRLLVELCFMYNLTADDIVGHRDVGNSDCPGDLLYRRLPEIRTEVAKKLATKSKPRFYKKVLEFFKKPQ